MEIEVGFFVVRKPFSGLLDSNSECCTRCRLQQTQLGEMGRMVVSTLVLTRYKIGDLIRAFQPPYSRCIGRDQWYTPLRYAWDEFQTFNLGQL